MSRYNSSSSEYTSFYRPKRHRTFIESIVVFLLDYLELYRQHRSLEMLDDRMLKDIGISRCDVEAEISRPFWR